MCKCALRTDYRVSNMTEKMVESGNNNDAENCNANTQQEDEASSGDEGK